MPWINLTGTHEINVLCLLRYLHKTQRFQVNHYIESAPPKASSNFALPSCRIVFMSAQFATHYMCLYSRQNPWVNEMFLCNTTLKVHGRSSCSTWGQSLLLNTCAWSGYRRQVPPPLSLSLPSECMHAYIHVYIRGGVQKFPDSPPGVRTANGTALCH
jgi:hypothetical protein